MKNQNTVMSIAKLWLLALGGIMTEKNGIYPYDLKPYKENERKQKSVKRELERYFGISDKESLLKKLDEYLYAYDHASFQRLINWLSAMPESYRLTYAKSIREDSEMGMDFRLATMYMHSLPACGILSWDISRYVYICINACYMDLIDRNEAWDLLKPLGDLIQPEYNGWLDYALGFMVGRQYSFTNKETEWIKSYNECILRLLNYPQYPWKLIEWNTPLDKEIDIRAENLYAEIAKWPIKTKVKKKEKGEVRGYLEKGVEFAELSDYQEAINYFDMAIQIEPFNYEAWLYMGQVFEDMDLPESALTCYEQILSRTPDRLDALRGKAAVLEKLNRVKEAEPLLLRILEIDPLDINSIHSLACLYFWPGTYQKSLEYYKKELEYSPDADYIHASIGLCYHAMDMFDKALESFSRSIEINPGYFQALEHRASLLNELGKTKEAWQDIEKAFSIDPENYFNEKTMAEILYSLKEESPTGEPFSEWISKNRDLYSRSIEILNDWEKYQESQGLSDILLKYIENPRLGGPV